MGTDKNLLSSSKKPGGTYGVLMASVGGVLLLCGALIGVTGGCTSMRGCTTRRWRGN